MAQGAYFLPGAVRGVFLTKKAGNQWIAAPEDSKNSILLKIHDVMAHSHPNQMGIAVPDSGGGRMDITEDGSHWVVWKRRPEHETQIVEIYQNIVEPHNYNIEGIIEQEIPFDLNFNFIYND